MAQYLVEEAKCDVSKLINFVNEMHILSLTKCYVHTFPSDMRDKNNQTPLHKSCGSWRDTLEVVQYLVKYAKCDISE